MNMVETQMIDNITSTDHKLTNPYAIGYNVRAVEIQQSTSADGWRYHKPNKKQKKNRR